MPKLLAEAGLTPSLPFSDLGVIATPAWIACLVAMAFVAWWGGLLVHELGHAFAALIVTAGRVEVHFPTVRERDRFALGRLDFVFDPGTRAFARIPIGTGKRGLVLFALAGPAASAALALAGTWLARAQVDGSAVLFWLGVMIGLDGFTGALNLIPFRSEAFPGTEEHGISDGLVIVRALRSDAQAAGPANVEPPDAARIPATQEFRAMLDEAVELARLGGEGCFRSAHLFAAIAKTPGRAASLLTENGVDADDVQARLIRTGQQHADGAALPYTVDVKRALTQARSIQQMAGDDWLDADHLLAALLREEGGDVSEILGLLGVDQAALRAAAQDSVWASPR
jgi:hypothetical protein